MKLVIFLSALVSTTAFASGHQVISRSVVAYPGADIDRYLSVKDLLISDEAQATCPNGVLKITSFESKVTGNFDVDGLQTSASDYPTVNQKATVDCK